MPEQEQSRLLKRQISMIQAVAIICGLTIGSGIFVSPQAVIRYSGSVSTSLLLWGVGGIFSACGALSFAELGTTFPTSGNKYDYLRIMYGPRFGPFLAFLYLWSCLALFRGGANAIKAITFANYILKPVYPDCPIPRNGVVIIAVAMIRK